MNSFGRLAIGLGTIGSAVGGGYALHRQLSTESVSKKLLANGYELLDKDSQEWTTILTNYKTTVSTNQDLKFGEFIGEPSKESTLKEECKKALETSSSDTSNYKKAEHWCTKPRSLEDVLKKQNFRLLIIKDNDDTEDQNEWNKKLDSHHQATGENQNKKFSDLNIASGGALKKDKGERDEIKKKCKELRVKKHYEHDFDSNLEKAKLWCAIENKQ
ncbi:hypothetical protein A6V39_00105 [Candidatus Mycoplasma haematobovis]|uniref:Uncharacterized protein n=1 Tax=Candidatus Mycoplasma haematobovis TaxID=432608 RepID=A0A1A9QEL2_9MOLU|nr:hypothetical protein [Candidatus Mycoplasma haematobovis]OAL10451.1 hypothetical protein A6V39_00105 [Candidatus Mycoplasma haematobovis]